MRIAIIVPALMIAGCSAAPHLSKLAAPDPHFQPEQFFAGRTEGSGSLKVALSRARQVQVHGSGRVELDGTLILDQVVEMQGAKPAKRQWRIRRVGGNRYSGSLTDARGAVSGEVTGNQLHLTYRMLKGGLTAEQRLYLQHDGRTAINHMTFAKLGLPIAVLDETIHHHD